MDEEGYGDSLWSKAEGEGRRYCEGERYIHCKECESAWYTVPTPEGKVLCWNCGAEIQLVIWFRGGPPVEDSVND